MGSSDATERGRVEEGDGAQAPVRGGLAALRPRDGAFRATARYVGAAATLGVVHWALHRANHNVCHSNIFATVAFGDSRLCSSLRRGCEAVDGIAAAAAAAAVARAVSAALGVFSFVGASSPATVA